MKLLPVGRKMCESSIYKNKIASYLVLCEQFTVVSMMLPLKLVSPTVATSRNLVALPSWFASKLWVGRLVSREEKVALILCSNCLGRASWFEFRQISWFAQVTLGKLIATANSDCKILSASSWHLALSENNVIYSNSYPILLYSHATKYDSKLEIVLCHRLALSSVALQDCSVEVVLMSERSRWKSFQLFHVSSMRALYFTTNHVPTGGFVWLNWFHITLYFLPCFRKLSGKVSFQIAR